MGRGGGSGGGASRMRGGGGRGGGAGDRGDRGSGGVSGRRDHHSSRDNNNGNNYRPSSTPSNSNSVNNINNNYPSSSPHSYNHSNTDHQGHSLNQAGGHNYVKPKGKWSNGPPQIGVKPTPTGQPAVIKEQVERFTFIAMSLVGCKVLVDCKDGKQYEGILHTLNPTADMGAVLRMARLVVGGKPTGMPIERLLISGKDFIGLAATDVDINGASGEKK